MPHVQARDIDRRPYWPFAFVPDDDMSMANACAEALKPATMLAVQDTTLVINRLYNLPRD